jgi:hypothetical protein
MRMKHKGQKEWEKVEVNFLDYFCWNFIAGVVLSITLTVSLVVTSLVLI